MVRSTRFRVTVAGVMNAIYCDDDNVPCLRMFCFGEVWTVLVVVRCFPIAEVPTLIIMLSFNISFYLFVCIVVVAAAASLVIQGLMYI